MTVAPADSKDDQDEEKAKDDDQEKEDVSMKGSQDSEDAKAKVSPASEKPLSDLNLDGPSKLDDGGSVIIKKVEAEDAKVGVEDAEEIKVDAEQLINA